MTNFKPINGSHGEGGGQILRSSLTLSMLTNTPIHITRIRAGRSKTGLLRQHLTAVRAAAALCGAQVQGDAIGSTELTFTPNLITPGDYNFAVGTAGSATLVLQTILPALMLGHSDDSRDGYPTGTNTTPHTINTAPHSSSGIGVPPVIRPKGEIHSSLTLEGENDGENDSRDNHPTGTSTTPHTIDTTPHLSSGIGVPPVIRPKGEHLSHLTLEGGTHNPYAPPFDFLQKVYLPMLSRMGMHATATLNRHGFYPAGGGRFTVDVTAGASLQGLTLTDRGAHVATRATALIANLPESIGEREIKAVRKKLGSELHDAHVSTVRSPGPGNAVLIETEFEHTTELFVSFGQHNRSSEKVAHLAAQQAKRFLHNTVAIGEYLTDQLLLPMALAAHTGGGPSVFTTYPLSKHATTQIDLISKFLPHVSIHTTPQARGVVQVTVD